MPTQVVPTQVNRVSGRIIIVLSITALLAVLSGYTQPPQADEGTAAHIFQLSIVALIPMFALFLTTADWRQPSRSARYFKEFGGSPRPHSCSPQLKDYFAWTRYSGK